MAPRQLLHDSIHRARDLSDPCESPVSSRAIAFSALALLACACGSEQARARPVVELVVTESIDPEVVDLARRRAALARGRPGDADLRADLAMVYEGNELWDEGERAWADALALAPDRPLWRYHHAICKRQSGDAEGALVELRAVVEQDPDLPAARHRLGEMLLEADDVEGAQAEFEASIRLVDFAPPPYVGLAEVMLRKGEHRRAAELCEKAISLDPTSKHARYNLGLAYRGLGRMAEAEAELNKGLNATKQNLSDPLTARIAGYRTGYTVRLLEAGALERQGKAQDAVPILEQLLGRYPDDVTVLNNLAAAYIETRRIDAAHALLIKAREIDPGEFATYINLAAAELVRGNIAAGLESAEKAVELAPKAGQAHFVRARAYLAHQRLGEAYTDLKESARLDATSGLTFALLGEVALRMGEQLEAIGHYETAARMMPDFLPPHGELAKLYFRMGERDKAIASYERARRLAPDNHALDVIGRQLGLEVR